MDEGDEYVPQMSLGDYSHLGAMPHHGSQTGSGTGYGAMSGGLQPMTSPYEQQQSQMMMMGGPPMGAAHVPPVPPQKPPSKRSSKKKAAKEPAMDPMQSMAAMSNNPMVRPSIQMGGPMGYPPQSQMGMYGPPSGSQHYAQAAYRTPQPYPPGQQAYMQPQIYAGQQRPAAFAAQGAAGGQTANPYGYPQSQTTPTYPHAAAQQGFAQMRPQYPQQGQGYWDQQQQFFQQQQQMGGAIPPVAVPQQTGMTPAPEQWPPQPHAQQYQQHLYQMEMEMRSVQQRMQQLYQQPRTQMVEQEIQQCQHRLQFMQADHHRISVQLQQHQQQQQQQQQSQQQQQQQQVANPESQQPTLPGMTPSGHVPGNQTQGAANPQQMPSQMRPGVNCDPMQKMPNQQPMVSIQHQVPSSASSGGPVHVTQSGSGVQVNIKPEAPGRTLISVYHRYGGESPSGSDAFSVDNQKDSVPPEPTPSNSMYPRVLPQQQQQQLNQHPMMHSVHDSMGGPTPLMQAVSGPSQETPVPAHPRMASSMSMSDGAQATVPGEQVPTGAMGRISPNGLSPAISRSAPDTRLFGDSAPAISRSAPDTRLFGDSVNGIDNGYASVQQTDNVKPAESEAVPNFERFNDEQQSTPQLSEETSQFGHDRFMENTNLNKISPNIPPTTVSNNEEELTIDNDVVTAAATDSEMLAMKASPEKSSMKTELFDDRDVATPPMRAGPDLIECEPTVADQQPNEVESAQTMKIECLAENVAESLDECDEKDLLSAVSEQQNTVLNGVNGNTEVKIDVIQQEDAETVETDDNTKLEALEDEEKYVTPMELEKKNTDIVDADDDAEEKIDVEDDGLAPGPSGVTVSCEDSPGTTAVASPQPTEKSLSEKDPTPSEFTESVDGWTEPSTPAPDVVARKPGRKPGLPAKARKKKSVDDSGDDDDDFYPQKKKRKVSRPRKKPEFSDDEREPPAKRSAGKWDSVVDENSDEGERIEEESQPITDLLVVEKILNVKEVKVEGAGTEEHFLIKWKGKAYVHCEWKTQKELEEVDKRVVPKIKRFKQKKAIATNEEDEDFNSDYLLVDRVVDLAVGHDGGDWVLIKWKSLGYDEVTWEPIEDIEKENANKVELWRQRQQIDKAKTREKTRPKSSLWRKMDEEKTWKDGNVLREYQFEGVDWLAFCYFNEQNCILADEMGLGKTVQTITFLEQVYDYGIHGPFLIVVPLSTIHHWVREFETWTDMNAVVYHGSAHAREILQQYEIFYSKHHANGDKLWKKNMVKLDALITTFEMVVTDCEFLRKIYWRVCIIDEAHRLKNRNCKLLQNGLNAFKMEHRVLLTGTPLQNSIDELFSLLNFLHPAQFASSSEFLEQFGQCQSDDQVQKLQEILKPMMLRRLKEDVEKSLQPKEETIIEVQLSDTQKKYYRAILERNFSHLCKGSSAPSLMNVMMELRKCCNHPFLIQGAEETIVSEMRSLHSDWDEETLAHKALVQASGKLVLIEKLLPKLRRDGHKVLIFSQMVKVLDLLEEFLITMSYPFERIDGNVRGDVRQQSIDRFSKKDSDRFVFLLCTRAGGLGINLTAADTVIIFDSDWNPQNDLQAQARCHRIGQTKMVKVYRLITGNTYEREMFDRASLKLGLDKAVLQSTTALKENSTALSKKDVEDLLKKGAYGTLMDDSNEGSKFNEEDIDTILQRRTTTITLETGQKGSLFAKASFNSQHNTGDDIDLDDPEFWTKWAEKAEVDLQKALATPDGRELILQEPRKRTKRFEEAVKEGHDSDASSDSGGVGRKRGATKDRKRKRGEDEDVDYRSYRPDELAFNKTEYFKVEKVLAQFGWGRWSEMKKYGELEVSEMDMMHMSRTLLLHCVRECRGDDRVRRNVWALIQPQGAKNNTSSSDSKPNVYNEGWAVLPEYNPPNFALDATFQRHIHRHANKLLSKIDQLYHIQKEMIGKSSAEIEAGTDFSKIEISMPTLTDPLIEGWDADCDKSLLVGIYRHGLDNYEPLRTDEALVFHKKNFEPFPSATDLSARFRRIVALSQKIALELTASSRWNKREEQEFIRVLKNFGMKDKASDASAIDWDAFKAFSPFLERKSDDDLQDMLYSVLAMCSRVQGKEITGMDTKRVVTVDTMTPRKAAKLMARLHLTRKIHALVRCGIEKQTTMLRLCNTDVMPSGWATQHDKELLLVADQHGIDNLSTNILQKASFQKIIRPPEKTLLRRLVEIVETLEHGKWKGNAKIDDIEDSDAEEKIRPQPTSRRGGGGGRGKRSTGSSDEAKMRALMQQTMLSQLNDPYSAALLQSALCMPGLLSGTGGAGSSSTTASSSSAQQQTQMLAQLLTYAQAASNPTSTASSSSSSAQQQALAQQQLAMASLLAAAMSAGLDQDALNLSQKKSSAKKESSQKASTSSSAAASTAATTSSTSSSAAAALAAQTDTASMVANLQAQAIAQQLGITVNELYLLASLPKETRIPVCNTKTKETKSGTEAPQMQTVTSWIERNPGWKVDIPAIAYQIAKEAGMSGESGSTPSSAKPSAPPTPAPPTPSLTLTSAAAAGSKAATPAPLTPKSIVEESKPVPEKEKDSAATATISELDQMIAVCQKSTGEMLSVTDWPMLSGLVGWLDSHSGASVHHSCSEIAKKVLPESYYDRIESAAGASSTPMVSGSASASASAVPSAAPTPVPTTVVVKEKEKEEKKERTTTQSQNSSAALAEKAAAEQLQMYLMQQMMMQQMMMGVGGSAMAQYAALAASASTSAPSTSTSASTAVTLAMPSTPTVSIPSKSSSGGGGSTSRHTTSSTTSGMATSSGGSATLSQDDLMNPLVMQQLMSNPLLMQALMMDPSGQQLAAMAAASQPKQNSTTSSKRK